MPRFSAPLTRRVGLLPLLGLATLLGCARSAPDGVALVGATLIDGSGAPPKAEMALVIRHGRIEALTPVSEFVLPPKTELVDVSGRWIIPGLIDAHAHAADWALPLFLRHGVTSVRDMGGPLDATMALRKAGGGRLGARVYTAGTIIDGLPKAQPWAIGVPGPDSARRAVDTLAVVGADFVKVYSRIEAPILRAITDEAKVFGLRVAGHLGALDAVAAAESGIRSLEHMSGVAEAAARNATSIQAAYATSHAAGTTASARAWATLDSAALASVATRLAGRRVFVVPTLLEHETRATLDVASEDPDYALVPEAERAAWDLPGTVARAGWTAQDFAAFRAGRARRAQFVREFQIAGGFLAAGSGAAGPRLVPGAALHRELELLVQAGLTPVLALKAATSQGALLLGADSIGMIIPGRLADLLILSKDPTTDIRHTRAIETVVLRGRLLTADSLR